MDSKIQAGNSLKFATLSFNIQDDETELFGLEHHFDLLYLPFFGRPYADTWWVKATAKISHFTVIIF